MKLKLKVKNSLTPSQLFFSITAFLVIVDQISKSVAWNNIPVACNRGVAFGLTSLGPAGTVLSTLVLILILLLVTKERDKFNLFAFCLIFAGGFSNLLDRLFTGCVRDFVKIGNFPSFNVADSAITIGVLLLIYSLLKRSKKRNEI